MDPSEKIELIVRNLKLLVDALESEVYSDVDAYSNSKAFSPKLPIMMRSLMTMTVTLIKL